MTKMENQSEKFPVYEIKGSAYERGIEQGKLLKNRIEHTILFYRKIIKASTNEIFEAVNPFIKEINDFDDSLGAEIEGIAEGSSIDKKWIYALNCRTELLAKFSDECTALFFPKTAILGQNWDWAKELEHLAVILKIDEGNNKILMMAEPGIIGKIGLNTHGIGVTLNILTSGSNQHGVPIHLILRTVLQSHSLDDALERIEPIKKGKSSNIIIGDQSGRFVDIEFCIDRTFMFDSADEVWVHTNHYLGDNINDPKEFESSYSRFHRASELGRDHFETVEDMKAILADKNGNLPICRKYVPDEYIDNVGTVTSLIMELKKRILHYTKGSPLTCDYQKISI